MFKVRGLPGRSFFVCSNAFATFFTSQIEAFAAAPPFQRLVDVDQPLCEIGRR